MRGEAYMKEKYNLHRDDWAENIEQILKVYSAKNDEAILYDFLNDSDLESIESPDYYQEIHNW